jgi:flagellin
MPLGILNNIPSLAAENELTLTSNALSNTLEQLSSGSRINSGADDPAGLSIANGLQANISALSQSVSNANDGVGELQLADGALAQVTNLLNTAVTLATESATGTVSNGQRTAIQAQYASILAEINQIGTATTYNGQSVFQGGVTTNLNAADTPAAAGTALTVNDALTTGDATSVTAGGVTFTYTAGTTNQVLTNTVTGSGLTPLVPSTALASGAVLTLTRATGTTIYTTTAATTVGALINVINSGAAISGTPITVTGTDTVGHSAYNAQLTGGQLQLTDLNNDGDLSAAATLDNNPNVVTGSVGALTGASAITAGTIETVLRNGVTTTYTAGTGATVAELITALTTPTASGATVGAAGVGILVGGTTPTSAFSAGLVGGKLVVGDPTDNGSLTVTESVHAVFTAAAGDTLTDVQALGSGFGDVTSTGSTVQNLINAINSDTTVGAKAALVGGQLQITDPLDRGNLAVTTNDTVLGAPVSGAPTSFVNPTTTTTTPNLNSLIGGATGLTLTSALTNTDVTSFTVGNKVFTYTAGPTSTVGTLINAINTPATDPAGLNAFLNAAGSLVVTDPNNDGNIAVSSTNTETVLGTYTNPPTTAGATTNIFLSDSTAIGSAQIAVNIGSLTTGAITNGSGGSAVNLAVTDLNTQTDAQTALIQINAAITNVASVRGTLGASVNRLTAASNVINSQVQNLTSAENTITAADIPTVVANLTKYSILEQTGISALAQANQQQQLVLKLLQ